MSTETKTDWNALAHELGKKFGSRAAEIDDCDGFIQENIDDLKAAKVYSMYVPAECGGGGATYEETCNFLRVLAHYCGSTALTLSMHTHLVAATVWRYKEQGAPVEGLFKKISEEQIILVSSGGSDWLNGSCTLEKTEGGFTMNGRKIFASGSPAGDLMMTMGVYDCPENGPTVMHFPVSLKQDGVTILDTWRTHGMRGTGSQDLTIENIFVPEESIAVKREKGKWHGSMHVVVKVAFPLIYSVYFGLAEAARNKAVAMAEKRKDNGDIHLMVGEMENELTVARLAREKMVHNGANLPMGEDTTNENMICRGVVERSGVKATELAMRVAGGAGFYRKLGLERIWRDIQAAKYHPLKTLEQQRYAGRKALGVSVDD